VAVGARWRARERQGGGLEEGLEDGERGFSERESVPRGQRFGKERQDGSREDSMARALVTQRGSPRRLCREAASLNKPLQPTSGGHAKGGCGSMGRAARGDTLGGSDAGLPRATRRMR
jgi:hypothetical protein